MNTFVKKLLVLASAIVPVACAQQAETTQCKSSIDNSIYENLPFSMPQGRPLPPGKHHPGSVSGRPRSHGPLRRGAVQRFRQPPGQRHQSRPRKGRRQSGHP